MEFYVGAGNTLTTAYGIYMTSRPYYIFNCNILNVAGATLNVTGDINLVPNYSNAGYTMTFGISGDASTVINLNGNFITSADPIGGYIELGTWNVEKGLSQSTINLLGGSVGTPHTFEVADNPSLPLGLTYLWYDGQPCNGIGTVNVGDGTTASHVQLVNNYANTAYYGSPVDILLTSALGVKAGSTLDLNGQTAKAGTCTIDALGKLSTTTISSALSGDTLNINGELDLGSGQVKVTTALTISGTLDIQSGGLLDNMVIANFVGQGDQTAVWSAPALLAKVIDSTMPAGWTFTAGLNGDGNTVFTAHTPAVGGLVAHVTALTAGLDDWVYQNTAATLAAGGHQTSVTVVIDHANGNTTYQVTLTKLAGDGTVTFPSNGVASSTLVKNIVGGNRPTDFTISGVGTCTIEVVLYGVQSAETVDLGSVTINVRQLGDVNGDGGVDASDKSVINSYLNGFVPATKAMDLNLDGGVDAGDKSVINSILNGVI
jgi:hypothetical protein